MAALDFIREDLEMLDGMDGLGEKIDGKPFDGIFDDDLIAEE